MILRGIAILIGVSLVILFLAFIGVFSPYSTLRPIQHRLKAIKGIGNTWSNHVDLSDVTFHISIVPGEDHRKSLSFMNMFGKGFAQTLITMDNFFPLKKCKEYGKKFKGNRLRWVCLNGSKPGEFKNTGMYSYILTHSPTRYLIHIDSDLWAMSSVRPGWVKRAKKLLKEGAAAVQMAKCLVPKDSDSGPSQFLSLRAFMIEKNSTSKWFPLQNSSLHIETIFSIARARTNTYVKTIHHDLGCYY